MARQCAVQMAPVRIQLASASLDTGVTGPRETTQCPEHNRENCVQIVTIQYILCNSEFCEYYTLLFCSG